MKLRYYSAWLLLIMLAPWLIYQAYRLRRDALRLPPARGARHGCIPNHPAHLNLLVMGESTVAGVGVDDHSEALSGQLATALHRVTGKSVAWEAAGLNGMVARETAEQLLPWVENRSVDVLVLALGVNDAISLRSPRRWLADLAQLVAQLQRELQPALTVVTAIPPVGQFPAIPQPLRSVFGLVARSLDQASRTELSRWDNVCYAALPEKLTHDPSHFAHDGFHPSCDGYRLWARLLADIIAERFPDFRK